MGAGCQRREFVRRSTPVVVSATFGSCQVQSRITNAEGGTGSNRVVRAVLCDSSVSPGLQRKKGTRVQTVPETGTRRLGTVALQTVAGCRHESGIVADMPG